MRDRPAGRVRLHVRDIRRGLRPPRPRSPTLLLHIARRVPSFGARSRPRRWPRRRCILPLRRRRRKTAIRGGRRHVAFAYRRLSLVVSYPEAYPLVAPILRLSAGEVPRDGHDNDDDDDGGEGRIPPPRLPPRPRSRPLHPLQERAILDVAYASITTIGEPCVYGIIVAVRDYLRDGLGLIQAGISMLLSDDCLVRILTYLGPRTVRDIEDVVDALPILRDASTRNAIWRPVCGTRWAGRWGYRDRWEGANRTYRHRRHDGGASAKTAMTTTTTIVDDDDNRGYWMRAYHAEEADATRDTLSRSKLTSVTEMWTMGAQVRF